MNFFKTYKQNLPFILLVLSLCTSMAQTVDSLFVQANKLYQQEKYTEALGMYKQIEEQGIVSSELYYNLGNVYYKSNQVAPSIYYYEKALLLKPNDKTIKTNLAFAQKRTIDNIKVIEELGFTKFIKKR